MEPIYHGVGINFGVFSTIIGVNGAFQAREHNYTAEMELIRDPGNTTVSSVAYDFQEHATFTYVAIYPWNLEFGDAIVPIPAINDWITVIDPRYPHIGGNWLVKGITTNSSNTTALRVTLQIFRAPHLQRL